MGVKLYLALNSERAKQCYLFAIGVLLLSYGAVDGAIAQLAAEEELDQTRFLAAVHVLLAYLEGSFGALVMVCAGIGAILSSAFGQYRAALSCLVVAVGAFILRSVLETCFDVELEDV